MRVALIASVALIGVAQGQVTDTQLTGAITRSGTPIPGVRVTAEGVEFLEVVVSDEQGAYEFRAIPRGAYLLKAEIPGYRTESRRITLATHAPRRLDFELMLGPLREVDNVAPESAFAAYQTAAAVAHIRIEKSDELANCVGSLETNHLATVLSAAKGGLPPTVWLLQEFLGSCFEKGRLLTSGHLYEPGEEYVAFLAPSGERLVSIAGNAAMIRVRNGRVTDDQLSPIRAGMTVEQVWGALKARR